MVQREYAMKGLESEDEQLFVDSMEWGGGTAEGHREKVDMMKAG